MKFKDAAYEVLKESDRALHYRQITEIALEKNFLDTLGETPIQSMGAALYTDTLKPDSRFVRGEGRGTFQLKKNQASEIQQKVAEINNKVQKDLLKKLRQIPPEKFEELIRLLLEEMGFEETLRTQYSNDKGVDVRGVLRMNAITKTNLAVQAKRWGSNVGSQTIRDLRGSLNIADGEQGLIITTSDFTASAIEEATVVGRTPISLINGKQLVQLLLDYKVGVKMEEYYVPTIDEDYWTEVLGIVDSKENVGTEENIEVFPLSIFARHKNQDFHAKLLNLDGRIELESKQYETPTTAAKTIATDWKQVNGWDFWKYEDQISGRAEKIGKLRKSKNKD